MGFRFSEHGCYIISQLFLNTNFQCSSMCWIVVYGNVFSLECYHIVISEDVTVGRKTNFNKIIHLPSSYQLITNDFHIDYKLSTFLLTVQPNRFRFLLQALPILPIIKTIQLGFGSWIALYILNPVSNSICPSWYAEWRRRVKSLKHVSKCFSMRYYDVLGIFGSPMSLNNILNIYVFNFVIDIKSSLSCPYSEFCSECIHPSIDWIVKLNFTIKSSKQWMLFCCETDYRQNKRIFNSIYYYICTHMSIHMAEDFKELNAESTSSFSITKVK